MGYPPQGAGLDAILAAIQTVFSALQVADPNSSENIIIADLLGNRNDGHNGGSIFSNLHDLWEGDHHEQLVWPTLADPITVTAHADDWVFGEYAEIVAANAITYDFHIHHLHIAEPSANGNYELILYNGTTKILGVSFSRTDKKDDVEGLEVRTPHCPANSQIQAKVASGNDASADTLKVKLWYHPHS